MAAVDLARSILGDTSTWGDRAACIGKAPILESPNETPAKTMCAYCPVIAECTRWVLALDGRADPGGVRAGMNERQRTRARRRRSKPRPVTVAAKRCSGCRKTKPAKEFSRHRDRKDGLAPECRDCSNARRQANRQEERAVG